MKKKLVVIFFLLMAVCLSAFCFIACGGTEIQAVDFIVAKKVLRKFESLSLGFMRDELNKCSAYLDKLFGKDTMVICKEYIEQLKKSM